MKKHLLLFYAFSSIALTSSGQTDQWVPIIQDGFGIPIQKTVPEMEVYNDTLYVATAPLAPPATAKLWRSGTGTAPWEDVTPPLGGDNSIHSFGQTSMGGGYFWLGTANTTKGGRIFQSRNGVDWIPISERGFGTAALNGVAPNMVVFTDPNDLITYLYAGIGSHGAGVPGEVWRIPYTSIDSTAWVKLIDFDTVATSISDTVDLISYFEVWNNKIYFGTNAKGQLWESSDGVKFTQNTGVGYGFAPLYLNNIVLSAIEIFNDTMYITTTNFSGGQLWRSADGITFTNITDDAFGEGPAVNELRKPVVALGKLWLTGYTETTLSTGTPVWRSDDGLDWVQSNTNGFDDTLNNGQNPSIVGFKNYLYFGGPNYTTGGQVWRTDLTSNIEEASLTDCQIKIAPNPFSDFSIITLDTHCPTAVKVEVYDIHGRLVQAIGDSFSSQITIKKGNMAPGLYFYRITGKNGGISSGKAIVD